MGNLVETESGVFVGGSWQLTGETEPVVDKYSGATARELHVATPAWAIRAVDAAEAAAASGPQTASERSEILSRTADVLRAHADEIVELYITETGFTRADAENELVRAQRIFELSGQEALRIQGEEIPVSAYPGSEGRLAFTIREPVGTVCAIAPFNAPLSTVAHKLAPALAAGNAVILKPAEATPMSSLAIIAALLSAGLDERFIQVVCGSGRAVGAALVEDGRIPYFTFTGSTAVGRFIRQASGLARTHLELGANSATIVGEDANLTLASELITRAGFRKAGQVCTSVQRVLAVPAVARDLADRLRENVSALESGDPRRAGVAVGPMISGEAAKEARQRVVEAASTGGETLTGGELDGSVLAPTVVWGAGTCSLRSEEAFAPVVLVNEVPDVQTAVEIVNAGRYGLQAGVFTQDLDAAMSAAKALRMGGVIINDTSSYHPDNMPYSGIKDSGHGVQGPKYAVQDMTNSKVIVMNLREPR